eukprot:Amastigsp_a183361_4.p2 type:complete len:109 gc:universal Amastigsp_a183361_4:109-435(+)
MNPFSRADENSCGNICGERSSTLKARDDIGGGMPVPRLTRFATFMCAVSVSAISEGLLCRSAPSTKVLPAHWYAGNIAGAAHEARSASRTGTSDAPAYRCAASSALGV